MKVKIVAIFLLVGFTISCRDKKSADAQNVEIVHLQNNDEEHTPSQNDNLQEFQNRKAEIALEFCRQYLASSLGDGEYYDELMGWLDSNDMTTPSFRTTLDILLKQAYEEEPELGLGYDPILDGQDYAQSYELGYYDEANDYFVLTGVGEESQFEIKIRVVEIDGRLLVDACGDINF